MSSVEVTCRAEAEMQRLGETIAMAMRSGDLVTLDGDLGAGKTVLARALLRSACGDEALEVPSPTFVLVQSYECGWLGPVHHIDLYRLNSEEEALEAGIVDNIESDAALVEWPKRLGELLPAAALSVEIGTIDAECRIVKIDGADVSMSRLRRSFEAREFLDRHGHAESRRHHLTGDASTRAYETIVPQQGDAIILMNAPPQPDGPPIRDGKPYSRIAHLAEDMRPFVGIATALERQGFRAPKIFEQDLGTGFLLIENLGEGSIIADDRRPIEERYLVAVETLAALHEKTWPKDIALPGGGTYRIPDFDRDALKIEVDLLADWYAPRKLGRDLTGAEREAFDTIWFDLIKALKPVEKSLVLRDFHSPNIIWIDGTQEHDRIGIIDFQDAMIGPSAYDVAALAQDARVDMPPDLENRLLNHYCAVRGDFDKAAFRETYAIMAAQRATKVAGIFVRLSKRDGKHAYLEHLPRIEGYLKRSLSHPALAPYRDWVENVLG